MSSSNRVAIRKWVPLLAVLLLSVLFIWRLIQATMSLPGSKDKVIGPSPTLMPRIAIPADKLTSGTGQLHKGVLFDLTVIANNEQSTPVAHKFHFLQVDDLLGKNGTRVASGNWEAVETVVVTIPETENPDDLQLLLASSTSTSFVTLQESATYDPPDETADPSEALPPTVEATTTPEPGEVDLVLEGNRIILQQPPDSLKVGDTAILLAVRENDAGSEVIKVCSIVVAFLDEEDVSRVSYESYPETLTAEVQLRIAMSDLSAAVLALDGDGKVWLVRDEGCTPGT